MKTQEQKLEQDCVNQIIRIENAIKLINSYSANVIKTALSTGQNLLFYNNGTELMLGYDSSFQLQINNSYASNKTQVIDYLKKELEYLKADLNK